mgnify:CR=1 FL=1
MNIIKSTRGKSIIVTGGAGFIGSAIIRHLIKDTDYEIINIDKLTYAGNLESLKEVSNSPQYTFEQVDICNQLEIHRIFKQYQPDVVMHLAAESHVDRSIDTPAEFINTNIIGSYTMLEVARQYWLELNKEKKKIFRFHHISTDEVYGDLIKTNALFTEKTAYAPSSPYSASKASSDHLVRAWNQTYKLPVVITNCSNNYGPYQFPDKLVPLIITNAISGKPLPIYGKGEQIRDWLYVEDHAKALINVLIAGKDGETYNIGGHNEKTNLEVVKSICSVLDSLMPKHLDKINKHEDLITFVTDRPGHDQRYAIDSSKIKNELGWKAEETFDTGIQKTVEWYLINKKWWTQVKDGSYKGERLGLRNMND